MTERTKRIKGLISGQVDMGTFGLVELELLEFDKELYERTELLREYFRWHKEQVLREYFRWHKEQGFVSHKDCHIDEFIASN